MYVRKDVPGNPMFNEFAVLFMQRMMSNGYIKTTERIDIKSSRVKHSCLSENIVNLSISNLEIGGQSTVPAKQNLHLKGNDILWS